MSAASAEIMAVGIQIHQDLQELFQRLNTPESIPFKPFIEKLSGYRHPVKRIQVDFAANMATCYVLEKLTLEIDIPRYDGESPDEFDETKVKEAHDTWTASRDTKYSSYARGLVKAGVGNVYIFLPKDSENEVKFVYLGKTGQLLEEKFQLSA